MYATCTHQNCTDRDDVVFKKNAWAAAMIVLQMNFEWYPNVHVITT